MQAGAMRERATVRALTAALQLCRSHHVPPVLRARSRGFEWIRKSNTVSHDQ
jgi:hypothetical protein